MIPLLVFLFILSGASGLIYESIWTRYLSLFVGHSAYAQVLVLVIFLGGMSIGAIGIGRISARLREPLLGYALVEAAVGVIGLVFHPIFVRATGNAYEAIFPALAGSAWLPIVKWTLAALLILPQSILLGATFPLMSAGVLRRRPGAPGRVLAVLYAANSLGAAAGVLLAGFWLVGAAGLPGTLTAAAILNLVVAAVVIAAQRYGPAAGRAAAEPIEPSARVAATVPATRLPNGMDPWRLMLLVSFGTAVASFVYEIAWIRMLSLVLGSATHSFELMLSAFILGLGLGSLWIRSRADRIADPIRTLGLVQWAMGLLALATLPVFVGSFHAMVDLMAAFARTPQGYQAFTLSRYSISLAVMLPATFCAGITLPLITRVLLVSGAGERAVGMVYGVNTLGSILGAAVAGLVLMPWIGLKGMLVTGAVLDIALGVLLLAIRAREGVPARRLAWTAAAAAAFAVVALPTLARFDHLLLTSGVYRNGRLLGPQDGKMVSYRDGRTASVSVRRGVSGHLVLSTNGKPDASLGTAWLSQNRAPNAPLRGDEATQVLLPLLTLAHAPEARSAVVIGQGSGMTSHILLGSPRLQRVVTVEIEPEVLRASRAFYPANRRVFDDPRARFAVDDAKSWFSAHRQRYDLVLSEPSNPWVSGVAGLFTTEFYRHVRRHMSDRGVFGQWLHLYEIEDELILPVIAALHQNFRFYEVFLVDGTNMLVVATNRAEGLSPDWSVFRYPAITRDLHGVPPFTADVLDAMRVASRSTLAPLVEGMQPNSDFFPVLDLGADRARFLLRAGYGFLHLNGDRFGIAHLTSGRRLGFGDAHDPPTPDIPRVNALALGRRLARPDPPAASAAKRAASNADTTISGLPAARQRKRFLEASMLAGTPPPDWRMWIAAMLQVEGDLHGGTAGVADEGFYRTVSRYLARAGAPPEAVMVVTFLHGLASWDFAAAAGVADPLIAASVRGEDWLPPDLLRDGTAIARLMSGDARGARRAFTTLTPFGRRRPNDLPTRLLESYIAAGERTARAPDRLGAMPRREPLPGTHPPGS